MNYHPNIVPDWVTDNTADLTDQLHDVCEDAAEWGHTCTGYFKHTELPDHNGVPGPIAELVGVRVDRGLGRINYYEADDAVCLLGADEVCAIEGSKTDFLEDEA